MSSRVIDRQRFKRIYPFYKHRPSDGTLSDDSSSSGNLVSPTATYIVINSDPDLPNERVITPGTGMSGSDGGAGGAYTLSVDPTVVAFRSGTVFTTLAVNSSNISADSIDSSTKLFVSGASFFSGSIKVTGSIECRNDVTGNNFVARNTSGIAAATQIFTFTSSSQNFTVPEGVTSVQVKIWGGGGGSGNYSYTTGYSGGAGGFTTGTLSVTPGEVLTVIVGGGGKAPASTVANGGEGGWPGGGYGTRGDASGGGGGGLSGIFSGSMTQANALMIAGGGGGSTGYSAGGGGGGGGGLLGAAGTSSVYSGKGGTQSAGGLGGNGTGGIVSGSALQGGVAYTDRTTSQGNDCGGGGAGYWGGGAGQGDGQSGGGGSGYVHPSRVSNGASFGGQSAATGGNSAYPSGSSDSNYVAGVALGGASGLSTYDGGNGLIVISYGEAGSSIFTYDRVSFTSGSGVVSYSNSNLSFYDVTAGTYTLSQLVGRGDPNAQFLTLATTASLNNERVFTPGTGLTGSDGGAGGSYTLNINNNVIATVSGTRFTGPVNASGGLSGSLQQLSTGVSYLVGAGAVTVISQSNGQIIISGTGGSGSPGGSSTQLQYNNGGTFGGVSGATFDGSALSMNLPVTASKGIDIPTGSLIFSSSNSTSGLIRLNYTSSEIPVLTAKRDTSTTSYPVITQNDSSFGFGHLSAFNVGLYGYTITAQASALAYIYSYNTLRVTYDSEGTKFSSPIVVGSTMSPASDAIAYFSGSVDVSSGANRKVTVFGGDTVFSGSIFATNGLSGSLQRTATGLPYLLAQGSITITTQSNGQIIISGSGAGGGGSGSPGGSSTQLQYNNGGAFGGVSGLTYDGSKLVIDLPVTASSGLSGSLQQIAPGLPYLLSQGSITITTQSNGQIIISGSGAGGGGGTVSNVQDGANYGNYRDVVAYSTRASTQSTTFVRASMFEFDPSLVKSAGTGTRTIKLRAIAETTGPQITVQLYNVTSGSVVSGSTLTTTSLTSSLLMTGDLTNAVNFSTGSAIYEVQMKMASGGSTSDIVDLGYAGLRIQWS